MRTFHALRGLVLIALFSLAGNAAAQQPHWNAPQPGSGTQVIDVDACAGDECAQCSIDQGGYDTYSRSSNQSLDLSDYLIRYIGSSEGSRFDRPEVIIVCVPDAPPGFIAKACVGSPRDPANCVVKLGALACGALGLTPGQGIEGSLADLIRYIEELLTVTTDSSLIRLLIQILHELRHCKDFKEGKFGCESEKNAFELEVELLQAQMTRFGCGVSPETDPPPYAALCRDLRSELLFAKAAMELNACVCESETLLSCLNDCIAQCKTNFPALPPVDCENLGRVYCSKVPTTPTATPSPTPNIEPTSTPKPAATPTPVVTPSPGPTNTPGIRDVIVPY